MTIIANRPNTALLIVDVQNDVVENAHQRAEVLANINLLLDRARTQGAPVVWVQHRSEELVEDSKGWEYVRELQRHASETLVHKQYGDSFEATNLEAELTALGVGRLIVTGAQTDACIRSTLHGTFTRGYDTVLVSDAHTTDDYSEYGMPPADKVIAHTNMYWGFQAAPGRKAGVVLAADVDFTTPGLDRRG